MKTIKTKIQDLHYGDFFIAKYGKEGYDLFLFLENDCFDRGDHAVKVKSGEIYLFNFYDAVDYIPVNDLFNCAEINKTIKEIQLKESGE